MSTLRVTSLRGRTSGTSPTLPDGAAITGVNVVGGGLTVTGVSTFFTGVNVVGGGLTVTGVSTFFSNVGIGTENADKVFVVKGTGGNYISEFHNSQDATSNNGVYIRTENTAAVTQPLNVQGQLIVTGAGNVGVGTELPSSKLEVDGTVTATGTNVTGVITATSFEGSGALLTGLPAGFTELDAALFN